MWWLAALGGAAAGALFGGLSTWDQRNKEKEAIEQQKKAAKQQYEYGKEYSDSLFNLRKTESLEQLDIQRRGLDTQTDLSFDDFNTNLLAQAFGIQDARIQSSSAIGQSLAEEGASGTRGNASNDMIRAYASQGLERNIDLQNKQTDNYLNRMITGANMTSDAISREKAAWLPGGYRYREKTAQDSYNANMYELGQSNYDWHTQQINNNAFLDMFTGIMGGASSGLDMGLKQYEFWKHKE